MGKRVASVLLLITLLAWAAAAQGFEKQARFPLAVGKKLRVEMPVGELRVMGGSEPAVRVLVSVKARHGSAEEIERHLEIRFRPGEQEAVLEIRGLNDDNSPFRKAQVRAEVTVPSETHLRAKLGVGALRVQNVTGDLRAHVGVGELRLEVADPALYRTVRAEVGIGDVRHPFPGRATGWLGKKYQATFSQGRYRLDADVGVGDVRISESSTI